MLCNWKSVSSVCEAALLAFRKKGKQGYPNSPFFFLLRTEQSLQLCDLLFLPREKLDKPLMNQAHFLLPQVFLHCMINIGSKNVELLFASFLRVKVGAQYQNALAVSPHASLTFLLPDRLLARKIFFQKGHEQAKRTHLHLARARVPAVGMGIFHSYPSAFAKSKEKTKGDSFFFFPLPKPGFY